MEDATAQVCVLVLGGGNGTAGESCMPGLKCKGRAVGTVGLGRTGIAGSRVEQVGTVKGVQKMAWFLYILR